MGYYDDIKAKYNIGELNETPNIANCTLRLELSNICNHRCAFCLNSDMPRKRHEMDEELVYSIIEQAGKLGVKKAGYFMNGEPFVSKNLAKYIEFSKEKGIEYVFITTNGALATEEKIKEVVDAGVDSIKFSINAGTRDTYKKIHGVDDFDKVFEHLQFAYNYRKEQGKKFRLLSTCVVTDDTINEIDIIKENVGPLVDELVFFHANNFAGQSNHDRAGLQTKFGNDDVKDFVFNKVVPCPYLFNTVSITCEGYMTLCVEEVENKMVFADLNEMTLEEAWNSDIMQKLRRKHIDNDLEGIQCFNCVYGADIDQPPINEALYKKSLK